MQARDVMAAAKAQGQPGLYTMWAGQAYPLCRPDAPAAEIYAAIVADYLSVAS